MLLFPGTRRLLNQCSKKRCATCSQFYDFSQGKKHECFAQSPRKRARAALETDFGERATVDYDNRNFASQKSKRSNLFNSVSSSDASLSQQEEEAEQAVPDVQTWVFDIETDQSCERKNVHKPIAKSFSGVEESFVGYNSVNVFCL